MSAHPAQAAACLERPEAAAVSRWSLAGFLVGGGSLQPFSCPFPQNCIPFGKIRLLADGFLLPMPPLLIPPHTTSPHVPKEAT